MFDFFEDDDSLMDESILTAGLFGMADDAAIDENEYKRIIAEDTFNEFTKDDQNRAISLDELETISCKHGYSHPDDPNAEPFMRWIDDVIRGRKKITDEL